MNGDPEHQRWLTARHEAGHAIAAIHYDVPLLYVSIERDGVYLGAARVAEPEVPQDAIVLFCGPLAETDWVDFQPGANIVVTAVGSDLVGLRKLEQAHGDLGWYYREALLFLSDPAIQRQIDRLARALLDHNRLSADEARARAEFAEPILPDPHP